MAPAEPRHPTPGLTPGLTPSLASSSPPRLIASLTTTVPSEAEAQGLARGLVEARLAACVQVETGVSSYYRWQGAVQSDAEVRLTVKTLPEARQAVEAFLGRYHPYQLPQLLWQQLEASDDYAAWVAAEVALPLSAPAAGGPPPPA